MEKLKIESNDGFLHLEDLPHNCIFNKVVTGCGGTTVVLQNAEEYVIAVPTTELIINKTDLTSAGISNRTYNGIRPFGLFGRFDDSVERLLKDYLNSSGTKKIMCTYDKVPKLMEYIQPKSYRLLIDEYHCLLKAYSYRQKAIDGVLANYRAFKSFCFMSATPITPDFVPSCLEHVTVKEADWGKNTETLKVELLRTNKPYTMAANIINKYKRDGYYIFKGHKSYEAFFFINSVKDIVGILNYCHLTNEDVRIICANNEENETKLTGYDISNSRSPQKMFNFITSKSFEGADYHSKTGICFVVSSASNPHTQASIDTDLPQIAGRIRTQENPFRYQLFHIFNTTYKDLRLYMTYEQMKAKTDADIKKAYETVKYFNKASKAIKNNLRDNIKHDLNSLCIKYDKRKDEFIINDILPKLELYNFQVNQIVYRTGLSIRKDYENNNIDATYRYEAADEQEECKHPIVKKIDFKEAFLKYAKIVTKDPHSPALFLLEQQQPLIREAYYKLGVERVRNFRYTKKSIEAALSCLDEEKTKEQKLANLMVKLIPAGATITVANVLEKMSQAYNEVGIKRTPKSKDLHQWFDYKDPYPKRINDKVTKVVDIYRSKIVFESNDNVL